MADGAPMVLPNAQPMQLARQGTHPGPSTRTLYETDYPTQSHPYLIARRLLERIADVATQHGMGQQEVAGHLLT